jgi:FkbM family methyltransferase
MKVLDGAVFLDVGGHDGATLEEAVKWTEFKTVHSFEPMQREYTQLTKKFGHYPHVHLHNYGLADATGVQSMYGTNDLHDASLLPGHHMSDQSVRTPCDFVEASEWFEQYISDGDIVLAKFNCEGSEVAILNNLIDTGAIWKISNAMIDWDCTRVFDGLQHLEQETIARFNSIGFEQGKRWFPCNQVMHGVTHQDRIANWIREAAKVV